MAKARYVQCISFEANRNKFRMHTWGLKNEEYAADFCLVAKRTLSEFEGKIFRHHFLLGADWKLCTRKLGLDRGKFFHAIYRIEQKLGRTFRELEPYPLFPLDEYFGGTTRPKVVSIETGRKLPPLQLAGPKRHYIPFPVKRSA